MVNQPIYMYLSSYSNIGKTIKFNIQGGPAKVRPTYIFDGNI